MNKPRIITIIALIVTLTWVSLSLASDTKELIVSTKDCCSILINYTANTVSYTSEELKETVSYTTKEDLDETVNAIQEYCYRNHFKH